WSRGGGAEGGGPPGGGGRAGGGGGGGTPPGGSPPMVRPRCSGASVIHAARGRRSTSRTRPMTLAVVCQPQAEIARPMTPTSPAGSTESIAWKADIANPLRRENQVLITADRAQENPRSDPT